MAATCSKDRPVRNCGGLSCRTTDHSAQYTNENQNEEQTHESLDGYNTRRYPSIRFHW